MDKKRILIISQLPKEAGGTYTTGIARVVENLYRMDFNDGIEVHWYFTNVPHRVATSKNSFNNQYNGFQMLPLYVIANILLNPIRTIREWMHYIKIDRVNPLRFEFYKTNFQQVIKKVKPDIIHLHGAGMSPLYYANRKTNIPIIITFHGVMFNKEDKTTWHFKPRYIETILMANYFTVLNQETKSKALLLGMPEDKCVTIPNGVDTSHFFFSEEQRNALRDRFCIKDSVPVFMTTGLVIGRKGQFDFLLALEKLGIDYQYWIIGKGPDEKKIANYVAEHYLGEKVKLLGYIDGKELFKYLSAADFYAHVSTTEGQALSEIEAYATGLRVIVRKEISGTVIGDSVNDHSNYYIWDADRFNIEEMKEWLKQKAGNRESRGKYDWSEIARQYGDLYRKLLS